jgi:glutathione S-transferase
MTRSRERTVTHRTQLTAAATWLCGAPAGARQAAARSSRVRKTEVVVLVVVVALPLYTPHIGLTLHFMSEQAPPPLRQPARLIVLAPSHFCEKARCAIFAHNLLLSTYRLCRAADVLLLRCLLLASWALERYGEAFVVEAHAPGFHVPAVKAAATSKLNASTPVLVVPPAAPSDAASLVLPDSDTILRWVDARAPPDTSRLFPAESEDEVSALCARFNETLGVASRAFVYGHVLDAPEMSAALAPPSVPAHERLLWHSFGLNRVVRALMRKGMRISPAAADAALDTIRAEFRDASARLQDGRHFLCGNTFTAADLTFAALSAPALGIAYGEYPPYPPAAPHPPPLAAAAAELRATPAGQFAMRMWAEERRRVVVAATGA